MNQFFNIVSDGYMIIILLFLAVFMLGSGAGLALQRGSTKGAIAGVMMAGFIVSVICYKATIDITQADQSLATAQEVPALAPSQELVYFNGHAMSRAEHEHLLAYSAQHSPGDNDH